MAAEFHKREERYDSEVRGITMGDTWIGLSATAANAMFGITLNEYKAAQAEAKAMASLLRDAHSQFVDLKSKLQVAKDDAVKAGMLVSDTGRVTFDSASLSESARIAYQHDPDYQKSVSEDVSSRQQNINRLVAAVTDADAGVEIALKGVVQDSDALDGTMNGFNAKPLDDIEKYEVLNTEEIAKRMIGGEDVSEAEIAEFARSMRDNGDDPAFAKSFLGELGADGTVKLSDVLADREQDSGSSSKQYTELLGGLANTVATATHVPGSMADAAPGSAKFQSWLASDDGAFYRQFSAGLKEAGAKNYDSNTNPLYGYRPFVEMMTHADVPYDDQFLNQLGDDMIAAEKKNTTMFAQWGGNHTEGRADALDSLLDVMSKTPDAATAFFDPEQDHGQSHLEYLVGSGERAREWPQMAVPAGSTVVVHDDPLSRHGLGAALEAGSTGHAPLGDGQDPWPEAKHNEAHARVMAGVVAALAPSSGTDASVPEALREPLANALGEYASDTHQVMKNDADYVKAATHGSFTNAEGSHLAVNVRDLVQVMRGVSEDPEAYGTLHKAESRYIDLEMERVPDGASHTEMAQPIREGGNALGVLTGIREDVINDNRMDEYAEADWKSKMLYHVVGGALTPLPGMGDFVQRGVDVWASEVGGALKSDADATANSGVASEFLETNQQMSLMVDGWAKGRSDIDASTSEGKAELSGLSQDVHEAHISGAETANKYLSDTAN
ncbi:hypothetical protein [Streptomyces sp. NBC_01012]|uniref:hypothetical protein n=1 Tax=Streptomyces sp. NBC_01012 TaxID=2903717 RepID=UPI0038655050|nr:hypothetical protein OG623_12555 [Streptomyces sp. NBC_01012]